jgi:hypothetical protein
MWVVFNDGDNRLDICKGRQYLQWMMDMTDNNDPVAPKTDKELGETWRKYKPISIHDTEREARAMVRLSKED